MFQRILVAAVTLALGAPIAAAATLPAGARGTAATAVVRIAEAGQGIQVQKRAPVVAKQRPMVVRKAPAPILKSQPTFRKSPSTIVRQSPPRIVKQVSPPIAMKKVVPLAKGKPVMKMPAQFVHVRPHRRHKWYGRAIGGVVLGSILAASVFYAYSEPPEDGLCWYWTSSSRERGYWDYCDPPEDD